MNENQIKNIVEISKFITDMAIRGATSKELDRVVIYLEGVVNDELEFDTLETLGGLNDLINKYKNK